MKKTDDEAATEFVRAGQSGNSTFITEMIEFLGSNKRWWMTPILLVFGLLAVLAIMSSTAAAPFIYSLF